MASMLAQANVLRHSRFEDRLATLGQYLDSVSSRELHSVLPEVLTLLFGYDDTEKRYLSILKASDSRSKAQDQILRLIEPTGILLKRIIMLDQQAGDTLRFFFPVSNLPLSSRQRISRGDIPLFYARMMANHSSNPMGGAYLQGPSAPSDVQPTMFEYFFMLFALIVKKLSKRQLQVCAEGGAFNMLLRSYLHYFLPLKPHSSKYVAPTILQSETFFMLLIELWLGAASDYTRDIYGAPMADPVTEDQLAAVMLMCRHLHEFTNVLQSQSRAAQYSASAHQNEYLRLLYRHSGLVRIKVYLFLKHAMSTDSLNLSLVLEFWLKYARPWRYMPNRGSERFSAANWGTFVSENFLSYVTVFHLFLARARRCDFNVVYEHGGASSSRSSIVPKIQAVLRLFADKEFQSIIENGERDFFEPHVQHHQSMSPGQSLRYQLGVFEDADFLYQPLFYNPAGTGINHVRAIGLSAVGYIMPTVSASNAVLLEARALLHSRTHELHTKITENITALRRNRGRRSPRSSPYRTQASPSSAYPASPSSPRKTAAKWFEQVTSAKGSFVSGGSGDPRKRNIEVLEDIRNLLRRIVPDVLPVDDNEVRTMLQGTVNLSPQEHRKEELLVERSRLYAESLNQPVRSYEMPLMVRAMCRLSNHLNREWEPKPWLYQTKREAENYLRGRLESDGAFAVRPNRASPGDYVLSVVRAGELWHDNLANAPGGYSLDGRTHFGEVGDLVHHYCQYPYCRTMAASYMLVRPQAAVPVTLGEKARAVVRRHVFPINLRPLAAVHVLFGVVAVPLAVGWLVASFGWFDVLVILVLVAFGYLMLGFVFRLALGAPRPSRSSGLDRRDHHHHAYPRTG